jgi:hypothetical protein
VPGCLGPGRGVNPSTGLVSMVDFGRTGLSLDGEALGTPPVLFGPWLPFSEPGVLTTPFGGDTGILKLGEDTDIDLGLELSPPLLVLSTGRNCGS